MPRAPSVDDLFGPMGRLDMHSLGVRRGNEGENASMSNMCANSNSGTAVKASSSPPGGAQLGLNLNQAELSGLSRDSCGEISGHGHDREGDASPRKNNPEGQSNFTSDEDKSIINERRQKRMISNRESARRSRLRKQQHLDELRSQIAHLQAENAHLVNRFSVASQQYVQLTEENSVLRSNATNLRHQLEMLHHGTSGHQLLSLEPHNLSSVHPLPFNLNLCSGATEDAGNWG